MPYDANHLDKVFHQLIKQNITLDDEDIRQFNSFLQDVLPEKMIKEMKNDDTFKTLFVQLHYVGSYYENLRVGKPTEFDVNLELQLPLPYSKIEIETRNETPGFARIKVGSKEFHPNTPDCVKRKIEEWLLLYNGYIDKDEVIRWLQGIVDKALYNIQWPSDTKVKRSRSGPALTLKVCKGNLKFDVDLVPVIIFGEDRWPPPPLRQLNDINKSRNWCVVPKAPRIIQSSSEWRMSFYKHEKELMIDQGNMKPVIKLFKLLRDSQMWFGLSSYYIKTMFLWEQEEQDELFWRNSLTFLFIHMLGRLQSYLQKGTIPFFWDKRCNLIDHLSDSEISNMNGRVSRLKKKLELALSSNQDPDHVIIEFFFHNSRCEVEEQVQQEQQEQQNYWGDVVAVAGFTFALGALVIGVLSAGNRKNNSS